MHSFQPTSSSDIVITCTHAHWIQALSHQVRKQVCCLCRHPLFNRRGSRSGQRGDTDRLLETARRHQHGREVRSCQVLQGRSDVPIRASSHHAVGRQVRSARFSRERTAAAGSSTQFRQSSSDTTGARTAAVARHPTRQVGKDETLLRAVSAWLGERGITPRNPRWMTMVRSEAVQRMALAARGECVISFSTCDTCLFVEAELVGRRDARFGILAGFFDG